MFTMLIPANLPAERMPGNVPSNMQRYLRELRPETMRTGRRGEGASEERLSNEEVRFDGVCAGSRPPVCTGASPFLPPFVCDEEDDAAERFRPLTKFLYEPETIPTDPSRSPFVA